MTRATPRASLLKKVKTYSNAPSPKRLERLCRALVVWLVSLCSSPTYAQSILAHKHERSRKWLESLITTWHDGIVNMMAAPQHPCHPVPLPLPASHGLPVEKRSSMTTPALSAALCSFVQSEFASGRTVRKLRRVIVAGVQEACRREMVSVFRCKEVLLCMSTLLYARTSHGRLALLFLPPCSRACVVDQHAPRVQQQLNQ